MLESNPTKSLLLSTRPDIYRLNAFRVTGLQVDATPREVARHLEKSEILQKFGKPIAVHGPMRLDPPPDGDALREAKQRLNDPQRRIVDEFFWFWPDQLGEGKTDSALQALAVGDAQGATTIWIRNENDLSEANVAMHNLAVLSHAWALDLEYKGSTVGLSADEKRLRESHWPRAYARWKALAQHSAFWDRLAARIRGLDDPRLTTDVATEMKTALPSTLLSINAQLAVRAAEKGEASEAQRHLNLMVNAGFDQNVVDEVIKNAVAPLRERIKVLCATAKSEGSADPIHADAAADQLLSGAGPLLSGLDLLLPAGNPTRDGAHDEVALQALICQVDFGNKTEDWDTSLKLLERTLPIAAGKSTRSRVQENLNIIRKNREFGTCFFCGSRPTEAGSETQVLMHGDIQRTLIGYNQTRTTWKHNAFKVPRCGDCARMHTSVASTRAIGLTLGFTTMIAFWISAIWWSDYIYGEPLAGWFYFLGTLVAFLSPLYLSRAAVRTITKGRTTEERKYAFPAILELQLKGWRLGQSPGVVTKVPSYNPKRGKLLSEWKPFQRWMNQKRPVFVSMFALCLPLPLILAMTAVLWGFIAGTPVGVSRLYHFGLFTKHRAVESLSDAAADVTKNVQYRARALQEISDLRPEPDPGARIALANLRRVMKDPNAASSGLRATAADLLMKLLPEAAVENLSEQLESPDSNLRRAAAVKLREMGPSAQQASANLLTVLNDSDPAVREAAAQALLKIAPDTLVLRLISNLGSADSTARQTAAALLKNIGPPARAAMPALEQAKKDSDISLRETIASALNAIDPKGHPNRHAPAQLSSYGASNTSYPSHEILPEGTYRVPATSSLELSGDRLSIDSERRRANELVREVNSLKTDVDSERNSYNSLVNESNGQASQINLERQYLDRTSQFAIDNYNMKVRNYNSTMEQLKYQQQRFNSAVDAYNTKLQELKSQEEHINRLVDDYNRKLESVGRK
jgi:hypothetical protein